MYKSIILSHKINKQAQLIGHQRELPEHQLITFKIYKLGKNQAFILSNCISEPTVHVRTLFIETIRLMGRFFTSGMVKPSDDKE